MKSWQAKESEKEGKNVGEALVASPFFACTFMMKSDPSWRAGTVRDEIGPLIRALARASRPATKSVASGQPRMAACGYTPTRVDSRP